MHAMFFLSSYEGNVWTKQFHLKLCSAALNVVKRCIMCDIMCDTLPKSLHAIVNNYKILFFLYLHIPYLPKCKATVIKTTPQK